MSQTSDAHVFVSYSTKDRDFVERLRRHLKQAGVNVWIDHEGLTPGTPNWEQALRDAIRSASAIILAASPNSRKSAYVLDELTVARLEKKPIYPVWVHGDVWINCISLGMGHVQHIDARGEKYEDALPRIIKSVQGQGIEAAELETDNIDITALGDDFVPRNPYKGLRPFRSNKEDQADFFGRETLIETLITRTENLPEDARLLCILGSKRLT